MRDDFAVFILTHGRPDRVHTWNTLIDAGYTGKVYVVIDDEDKTAEQYRKTFGDRVLTFSKAEIAQTFDEGDNFQDRRAIIYARNAAFDLAEQVGVRYFIELDDDYTSFFYRFHPDLTYQSTRIRNLDAVLESMVEFLEAVPRCHSIAMSQGGDHIGGAQNSKNKSISLSRKAMNTFICDTQRRFNFVGRINEDVNTYTCEATKGLLFFTFNAYQVTQVQTQQNAGGMTDLYLDAGTFVKSFYSVMYCPSAVKIGDMGQSSRRIHHHIAWNNVAPKIMREAHRKAA